MSRQSQDQYDSDGKLVNGYDYQNQCWVMNYIIQDCGHPLNMKCSCFGRKNKGQATDIYSTNEAQ